MNTEEGDTKLFKKVEQYFSLITKLIVLVFAAGRIYGELKDLDIVTATNSSLIIDLRLDQVDLRSRISALERQVYGGNK